MKINKKSSTNYQKYTSKNILKRIVIKKFVNKIISIVNLNCKGNEKILDAACGEGFITNEIYNKIDNIKIIGIDNNQQTLNYAKSLNSNIKFVNQDINNLNFKDNEFDIVLALEVLEHLKYPEKALNQLLTISKKIIISIPNEPFFSLGNLITFKNFKNKGTPKEHINIWTLKTFKKFLATNRINNYKIEISTFWIIVIVDNN